jgi:hypothetical protein
MSETTRTSANIHAGPVRTDDLIGLLAAAPAARPGGPIALWMAGGVSLALALVLTNLGLREDYAASLASPEVWMKLAFTALMLVGAGWAVRSVCRPGASVAGGVGVMVAALALIVLSAGFDLAGRPIALWPERISGDEWRACLTFIPFYALPAMLLVGVGMRRLAPTDLARAGLLMGLAGGAASAVAYAHHCSDDAAPFVAVWYIAGIAVAALIGRVIGPRLLRW